MNDLIKDISDIVIAFCAVLVALFFGIKQIRNWKTERAERKATKCEIHSESLASIIVKVEEHDKKINELQAQRDKDMETKIRDVEVITSHSNEINQLKKDFRTLERKIGRAFKRVNAKVDDVVRKIEELPYALIKIFDKKLNGEPDVDNGKID